MSFSDYSKHNVLKNRSYLFMIVCMLLSKIVIAQEQDTIDFRTTILSLKLDNLRDFEIYHDSIENNRASLSKEDLLAIYKNAFDRSKNVENDSLFYVYLDKVIQSNFTLNDYNTARANLEEWLAYSTALKDTSSLVKGMKLKGDTYLFQYDQENAIEIYKKAIEIARTARDKKLEMQISTGLASAYLTIGRKEEAISLLKDCIAYFKEDTEEIKSLQIVVRSHIGLLVCYMDLDTEKYQDSIEATIERLDTFVTLFRNHEDYKKKIDKWGRTISQACHYMASYYLRTENLTKGEYYYHKFINADVVDPRFKYLNSFLFAIMKKDTAMARQFIDDSKGEVYKDYYPLAFKYYQLTGNFEKQLHYQTIISDIMLERLKADKVTLKEYAEAQRKNAEQEQEILLIQKESEALAFQKKSFLAISILLGSLLFSVLYFVRHLKKRNQLLVEKKAIIEEQAASLQSVNEQKSVLFANIAHEFQTPLAIITGLAKKVKSFSTLPTHQTEQVDIIINNSQQLSESITQILELTKKDEIPYVIDKSFFCINELVQDLITEIHHITDSKKISVVFEKNIEGNIGIYTDFDKMKTILKNLLSNAIKYTPLNGTIELVLTALKEEVEIVIQDNGKGISDKELTSIFDRFYQSDSGNKAGGFGLGLAICKEYTEALEGQINVQSIIGMGSQFSVKFPLNTQEIEASDTSIEPIEVNDIIEKKLPTKETIPVTQTILQDKQVLIIEDNLDFCKYLNTLLDNRYTLVYVHNGPHALEYLKNNIPDIIITDWMLPEMDGLELVQQIKIAKKTQSIPILMLTARNMLSDQLRAITVGVDDYLVKTFEEASLIERIESLLSKPLAKEQKEALFQPSLDTPLYQDVENISKQEKEWLLQFESLVLSRIGEFDLNLDIVADSMDLSVTHLSRKIKAITGISAKKYITEIRFWEARRLLELKQVDSVKAVAFTVGFKNPKYFSKNFKNRFDKYPSEYLNE